MLVSINAKHLLPLEVAATILFDLLPRSNYSRVATAFIGNTGID